MTTLFYPCKWADQTWGHTESAASLVIADGQFNLPQEFVGCEWVNILTFINPLMAISHGSVHMYVSYQVFLLPLLFIKQFYSVYQAPNMHLQYYKQYHLEVLTHVGQTTAYFVSN